MRLAGIVIGTNSTRLLLAEVEGERVAAVKTDLITTRLGQGINGGSLLPEAMERTLLALEQFLEQIHVFGAKGIITAATSAVRDAVNKEEFLQRVKQRTGLQVLVLSGMEEAAASYRGVLSGLSGCSESTLVLDVGGGSTEMIWPEKQGIQYVSCPVGAVRMTEGGHSPGQITAMLADTLQRIREQAAKDLSLVAVGGTATSLAAMSLQLEQYQPELVHGSYLPLAEIERLYAVLAAAGPQGRKKIKGLQPQRADIILAGVKIIEIVLQGLNLPGLRVSEADILHGLVIKLARSLSE